MEGETVKGRRYGRFRFEDVQEGDEERRRNGKEQGLAEARLEGTGHRRKGEVDNEGNWAWIREIRRGAGGGEA